MSAPVFDRITKRPSRFELFQALRMIEQAHPEHPPLGDALRPSDEPVRFAGEPALDFAASAISRIEQPAGGRARLVQRVFGFFGPNGALPLHLTEYARDRVMHHGDRSFAAFADMLLHRFGLFFYRAWARSNPAVGLDRGHDAPIVRQLGALAGLGLPAQQQRDALGDFAKLHFVSRLARSVRDADGLQSWIALRFGVPVQVQQFCGHWMTLEHDQCTRLGRRECAVLGRGAVLGSRVWDVQHKFRIEIGPLDRAAFDRMLPGQPALQALQAMVRQYVGFEFAWDLKLVLHAPAATTAHLGRCDAAAQLGRSTWLEGPHKRTDRLVMNIESICRAHRQGNTMGETQ